MKKQHKHKEDLYHKVGRPLLLIHNSHKMLDKQI